MPSIVSKRSSVAIGAIVSLFAVAAAIWSASWTDAQSQIRLTAGPDPLFVEPDRPFAIDPNGSIAVAGVVTGESSVDVLLRVDDAATPAYAERVNIERRLPPGPFRIELAASDLVSDGGRALDLRAIHRVIFVDLGDTGRVHVAEFRLDAPKLELEFVGGDAIPPIDEAAPDEAVDPSVEPASQLVALIVDGADARIEPSEPIALDPSGFVLVEGVLGGDAPAVLELRVDDLRTPSYDERHNSEHRIAPGAFALRLPLAGLSASDGRPIDLSSIFRVIVFAPEGGPFAIERAAVLGATDAADAAPPAEAEAETSAESRAPAPVGPDEPLDFGSGALPIEIENWFSTIDLGGRDEIVIEGTVETASLAGIVLRIDDGASEDYGSRFNLERDLPPGPFRLTVPLTGLRTINGRIMDLHDLRQIILFAYGGEGVITITDFRAQTAPRLPDGAVGYAFGPEDAPVPSGFEGVGPWDPRISGADLRPIRRPAPDPLIASGVSGVHTIRLSAPTGRALVTVWTEDPGEWEFLPHPLTQRIDANGVTLINRLETPEEWLARRYRAGAGVEHGPDDTAWTAFGVHRGGVVQGVVDIGDDGLTLRFRGDAAHVAGVLIEPVGDDEDAAGAAFAVVQDVRRGWYEEFYRVADPVGDGGYVGALTRASLSTDGAVALRDAAGAPVDAARATTAPGAGVRLTIEVAVDADLAEPSPALGRFDGPGGAFEGRAWAAMRRLERLSPSDTVLRLADNTLRADLDDLSVVAGSPRRYEIWATPPAGAAPGLYRAQFTIGGATIPLEIEVLDVALPAVAEPAGFYLAEAPHLTWFGLARGVRTRQADCDVAFMRSLGIDGGAPMVGPAPIDRPDWLAQDLRRARDAGLPSGLLAYNPLDLWAFDHGVDESGYALAEVIAELERLDVAGPVWSVADEIQNEDRGVGGAFTREWVAALRRLAPSARLGGHMNRDDDRAFLDLFDVAIVNVGFGLDIDDFQDVVDAGVEPWIYNTLRHRVTAGLWLWRTPAAAYVQWHGRLPTADPYDPLDGREGDAQMIFPSSRVCPETPDIHRGALQLADGLVDQRWLLWLDATAAAGDVAAAALRDDLRARFDGEWAEVSELTDGDLAAIRAAIQALAR